MADPGFLPPASVGKVPGGGPPRIPRIQPEAAGVSLPPQPSLSPQGLAELSTRASRALAGELGQAARQAESIHAEHERIKKTLQAEQDALDATEALNQYRLGSAQYQIDLKKDGSVTANDYAPRVEDFNRKNRETVGKTLKTDAARLRFERAASGVQTEAAINARAEGLQMLNASVRSGADLQIQDWERVAVNAATPAKRAEAEGEITKIIDRLEGKSIFSGAEAGARRVGTRTRIAKGRIQVEWQDPEKRPAIIAQLTAREVIGIDADDQGPLLQSLKSQQYQDEEREYTKDKRAQAERATAAEKDINDAWRSGDLAKARQLLETNRRDLTSNDYMALDERIQQPPKPPAIENDRATMLALQPEVYSVQNDPRKVLPLVHRALHDGKINDGTHRVLANELQNRILAEDQRRERAADRAAAKGEASLAERKFVYTQGKDILEETFKTTGMLEKFDTDVQDAKTDALQDFYVNTNPYNPKMTTQEWVARRLPEYQARVATKANSRFTAIDQALVTANIPVQGNIQNPQTASAVRSYLKANQGELIRKHGPEGFADLAAQVREAEIMGREIARVNNYRATRGGGGGAPAAAPAAPAPTSGQPGGASQPFQKREKSGGR